MILSVSTTDIPLFLLRSVPLYTKKNTVRLADTSYISKCRPSEVNVSDINLIFYLLVIKGKVAITNFRLRNYILYTLKEEVSGRRL